VAVMALERVPADIRKEGGVARMSDPTMIREIKKAVTIPVMAKARIGHFVEAQILEALEVDYVDESEVIVMCGNPALVQHCTQQSACLAIVRKGIGHGHAAVAAPAHLGLLELPCFSIS